MGLQRTGCVRARAVTGAFASVAILLAGCVGGGDDDRANAYVCTVSETGTDTEVSIAHVTAATSRKAAVLVDPADGTRTYAATREYDLSDGWGFGRALLAMKQSLGGLAPAVGASVDARGTASLAFVYERPEEQAARDILDARLPPSGWTRMIVGLKGEVAGSATAGIQDIVDAHAGAEIGLAAYLTLEAGGEFTVTRWWGGSVSAGAGGLVGRRLGAPAFSGAVSTALELRFTRDGRLEQVRTITERDVGQYLLRTTGLLDLGSSSAPPVPGVLAPAAREPLNPGPSSGSVFFGTGKDNARLWDVMTSEATVVRARYLTTSTGFEIGALPSFGVGFRRTTTNLTLRDISIQPPHGKRTLTCEGKVRLPEPAAARPKPEVLKPTCVPPADGTATTEPAADVAGCLEPPKAVVTVTPDALVFPELPIGEQAQATSAVVRNTGSAPLTIGDISLGARDPQDFTVDDNGCGTSLQPDQQCLVTVGFSPTADGERRATLTIPTDAAPEPSIVAVTGTGVGDRPDLVITSSEPRNGTDLIVTVRNIGQLASPPSTTRATFTTSGTTIAQTDRPTPNLASDESTDVTFELPEDCQTTGCDVVVKADAEGDILERSGNNNELATSVAP